MSVQSSKLLVVLVSPEGLIKTTVIQLPFKVEQPELAKIARFLNEEFEGLTLDEIKQRLAMQILSTHNAFFHLMKQATQILDLAFASFDRDILYLEGTSHILEQPDFQDAHTLHAIFSALEKEEPLLSIMKRGLDMDGVRVHIGEESHYEGIQECSLVLSNYKVKNKNLGTLGIIGPRRMSYAKIISLVDYMARHLSERIMFLGK